MNNFNFGPTAGSAKHLPCVWTKKELHKLCNLHPVGIPWFVINRLHSRRTIGLFTRRSASEMMLLNKDIQSRISPARAITRASIFGSADRSSPSLSLSLGLKPKVAPTLPPYPPGGGYSACECFIQADSMGRRRRKGPLCSE